MSYVIVPQAVSQVKPDINNRNELLELADHALQEFNRYWASWIVTGDSTAYRLALAAREDRKALLVDLHPDEEKG